MSILFISLKWFLVQCLRVTQGAQDLLAPKVVKAPCFNLLVKMFYRIRCKDNRIYTVNLHPSKTWEWIKWRILNKLLFKTSILWSRMSINQAPQLLPIDLNLHRWIKPWTISGLAQIWMSGRFWPDCKILKRWRKSRPRTTFGNKSNEK